MRWELGEEKLRVYLDIVYFIEIEKLLLKVL